MLTATAPAELPVGPAVRTDPPIDRLAAAAMRPVAAASTAV
jgi:hypothetical protein